MSKELAIIAQTDAVGNFVQSFRHKKAEVLSISMAEVSIFVTFFCWDFSNSFVAGGQVGIVNP